MVKFFTAAGIMMLIMAGMAFMIKLMMDAFAELPRDAKRAGSGAGGVPVVIPFGADGSCGSGDGAGGGDGG
jgi:hypothetical protein